MNELSTNNGDMIENTEIDNLEKVNAEEVIEETIESSLFTQDEFTLNEDEKPNKLEQWEKEKYARENMDLIHYVANKFRNTRLPYDDIYSVCMMGYTKALNAYDRTRGVKLSTFAVNCMQNEVRFYLRKEKRHSQNVTMGTILSQDKNGNDFRLEDILSQEGENVLSIEESYELEEDKGIILEAIKQLTDQEQYIMNSRYGLNGCKLKTQKLIAEEIDMSQANVSKIQKNCIDKIRKYIDAQYKDERIA